MTLTPSDRATYKTEIAHRLSPLSWSEIDVTLGEFGAPTEDIWNGDQFSYVLAMIKELADDHLEQLARHLNVETGKNSLLDPPEFWRHGELWVFISHISAHKVFASELQASLAEYGICSFVAHEDIEPDAEWQAEIEKALRTCDALLGVAPCKWSTNWDRFVPQIGGSAMAGKREKPEEIVSKLRQVEVLQGQGMTIAEAVRQIGVTQQTYYRWRKMYGGMGRDQLKRLKELEKENQRLRRAVSDLTLDKLILTEAAKGNF